MDFVIYYKSNGYIKQVGTCPVKDIDLQQPSDTSLGLLKNVSADPNTQMVNLSTMTIQKKV